MLRTLYAPLSCFLVLRYASAFSAHGSFDDVYCNTHGWAGSSPCEGFSACACQCEAGQLRWSDYYQAMSCPGEHYDSEASRFPIMSAGSSQLYGNCGAVSSNGGGLRCSLGTWCYIQNPYYAQCLLPPHNSSSPPPPTPRTCANNDWTGYSKYISAECDGKPGSQACWDNWCKANCDPFGQLHPACAVQSSAITGDTRCVCRGSQPPTPQPVHHGCDYRFSGPSIPAVTLPPAQPASPGDIWLTPGNYIVMQNGRPISEGCNGDVAQYYHNHAWTSSYIDSDNQLQHSMNHIFYVTAGNHLNIATLQTWQSNLATILNNTIVRLAITCNNGEASCVELCVGSCPGSPPPPPVSQSCANNDWAGYSKYISAQCDGKPGTEACWDRWCKANCDPFGQLHPACAVQSSAITGDTRCVCQNATKRYCIHEVEAGAHKCYQGCAGRRFSSHEMPADSGPCPSTYSAVDSTTTVRQCADGKTNVKYCPEDQLVDVTFIRKGIAMLLGDIKVSGYTVMNFPEVQSAWNAALGSLVSSPDTAVQSKVVSQERRCASTCQDYNE